MLCAFGWDGAGELWLAGWQASVCCASRRPRRALSNKIAACKVHTVLCLNATVLRDCLSLGTSRARPHPFSLFSLFLCLCLCLCLRFTCMSFVGMGCLSNVGSPWFRSETEHSPPRFSQPPLVVLGYLNPRFVVLNPQIRIRPSVLGHTFSAVLSDPLGSPWDLLPTLMCCSKRKPVLWQVISHLFLFCLAISHPDARACCLHHHYSGLTQSAVSGTSGTFWIIQVRFGPFARLCTDTPA